MQTAEARSTRKVEIEFLYLDLDACTRCKGTDANLGTALHKVRAVLEASGVEVAVRKVLVNSESTALKHRLASSPTIRVNGRDIALEFRETPCDTCTEACGCNGIVDCRVWVYEGKEYTEAPVPLILNALLTAIYAGQTDVELPSPARPFVLPDNLRQFFAGSSAKKAAGSCCSAQEQVSCCESSDKKACCGSASTQETTACACR
jgi:hypothetical protein